MDPLEHDFLRYLWVDEDENDIIYRQRGVVFEVSSTFLLAATIEYYLRKYQNSGKYSRKIVELLLSIFYVPLVLPDRFN